MATSFTPHLELAASGRALTPEEMRGAIQLMLDGNVTDTESAGFLMALRVRGETVDEITAAATVMREKAQRVEAPTGAIDTCGTGGDGSGTFNISTAVALVAAGCGLTVAKHGNKAASSKSVSNIHAEPAQITRSMEHAGVGFMFAAAHHKAVAHVAGVRTALGVRTLFNMLGPLTNPAGAKRQLLGVYAKDRVEPLAKVLLKLGAETAWVVHGADGLDEISTTSETFVAAIDKGEVKTFSTSPEEAGLPRASMSDLKGGGPEENAAAIRRLLDGEKGAYRDIVILNTAAAAIIGGKAKTISDGAALAADAIDNGNGREALNKLVHYSNEQTK